MGTVGGWVCAAEPAPITSIEGIRALSAKEASGRLPVRIQGTVTYCREDKHAAFVQDGEQAISCGFAPEDRVELHPGDFVEVTGFTMPGGYAPGVGYAKVRVLGTRALPAANSLGIGELETGRWDSHLVEVTGVVHRAHLAGTGQWIVDIIWGRSRLQAYVERSRARDLSLWVDSRVRVRGVAGSLINSLRQLIGVPLRVHSADDFTVLEAAPEQPFEIEARSIESIMRYSRAAIGERRIKISGTVLHLAREGSLYLQDDTAAMRVSGASFPPLRAGDRVEVLGFPAWGQYAPHLEDAVLRRIGDGPPPAPEPVTAEQAMDGRHEARLVRVQARLLALNRTENQSRLVLRAGNRVFQAVLADEAAPFGHLRPGSVLAATGICHTLFEPDKVRVDRIATSDFVLLLRSPVDVAIIRAASWWNKQRVIELAAAISALLLMSVVWVIVLRRRVARQTAIIADKLRAQAATDERARIARDMHDAVGARLTQLSLLHDLALADRSFTGAAREKLRHASTGTHEVAMVMDEIVWSLNPKNDTLPSLIRYLARVMREYLEPLGIACLLELPLDAPARAVSSTARHAILSMVKECLQNIAKHAHATQVQLAIRIEAESLRLTLADNGTHLGDAPPSGDGHDGLGNLHGRAAGLGGEFSLQRKAASTEARITLPLSRIG